MRSYHTAISIDRPAAEVFKKITQVPQWWTTDFEGKSAHVGDEFIIHHPGAHYAKHLVEESVLGQKLIWLVTESKLDWLQNQNEWTGTKMIFELSAGELKFTHKGLTPDKESYERCSQGWKEVILQKLSKYIHMKPVEHTIQVDLNAAEIFQMIGKVSQWWISNVDGPTENLNDEFTVSLGTTWKKFRITEKTENKVVWEVVDCNLPWLEDIKEWKGTKITWEVKDGNIRFTHNLDPNMPCYNQCERAWGNYIGESLLKFITEGKGFPNRF